MIMVMNKKTNFEINISSQETLHMLDCKWLTMVQIAENIVGLNLTEKLIILRSLSFRRL
jgi:hypothetical protein